ncbi:MAG: hypothetical protein JXA00_06575 [Candidatus Thermoplasmatota archaeon]|nr:hypothetical protein [Candidatus Thermoplasmatota archaeon]
MSRFPHNDQAFIDLTVSHIGLMIAVAILLLAVFSFLANSDIQRTKELQTIASRISTQIAALDAGVLENTTVLHLPDYGYDYTVTLSTEYVSVAAQGAWGADLMVRERFVVNPWPQDNLSNLSWMGGRQLHAYLKAQYGQSGNQSEPMEDVDAVREELTAQREHASSVLSMTPLVFSSQKPLIVEKAVVYFQLPPAQNLTRAGDQFSGAAGDYTLPGDGTIILSPSLFCVEPATVWYNLSLLAGYTPLVLTLDIGTYYDEDGLLGCDGPQLSLFNWQTGSYQEIVPNLGDVSGFTWRWEGPLEGAAYCHQEIRLRYHIQGGVEAAKDHTVIKTICATIATSHVAPLESDSFVLLYQE